MGGLRALLLLMPLLGPGCAGEEAEQATAAMQRALAQARTDLAVAGGRPAPVVAPPPAAADRPSAASPPLPAATEPAPLPDARAGPRRRGAGPPASAAALLGLRAESVRRDLGEPALRRPEGDAEIWLYEAAECRLDVVLYREGAALVVAHAAARAHAGASVTEAACLQAIGAAPAPAPWTGPTRRA